MKILAIESSGSAASAAILEDEDIIIEKKGPFKITHSETLMPLIKECFEESGLEPSDMDLIAVSGGPGSFTGLRIGSATAKGLGFALGKDLVHVPTLDAMAMNCAGSGRIAVPMMDARRGQVYTGIYEFEKGFPKAVLEGCAMDAGELMDKINSEYPSGRVIFLGDGADAFKDLIIDRCRVDHVFAEGGDAYQRASSVGLLGYRKALNGETVSAADEAPVYLRPSQAERVRAEQNGN